ncbi:MAG: hypothetical protein RIG63_16025 [Coleofasciculus chthonoplastes F3-SA18-01]|uniref:hypothetical protein n=1 Tax=Coleofasciculus chthonoplastes TaxID=64178 RepID=UPI0033051B7A
MKTYLNYIRKGLDNISIILFADGWLFLLPYLLLYLYFKYFNLEISGLKTIFIILHCVSFFLFLHYLNLAARKIKASELFFWVALLLLFLIPGAYLEFPSDPWEHFRRIFSWQASDFIQDNQVNHKFTYFWGWTLMFDVPLLYRRVALDIYSTFWQLLLAYQFYLLALRLGFSKYWAKVQIVATIFLFGTNLFGFYRYYALSSTPLAYIAYLRAIIVLMNARNGQIKQLGLLIPLGLIMYYNHWQELMLLCISGVALFLDYMTSQKKHLKKFIYVSAIIIPVSFALGAYLVKNPQIIPTESWSLPYVSQWGTFRIWDAKLSYFETFGIHGLISLILAIVFLGKYKTISILTLTPYLLMLFPPFVLFFALVHGNTSNYVTYRALYAFPTSFMFVLGGREILMRLRKKLKLYLPRLQVILSVLILGILMVLPPMYPYRGRFWFQVYQPPAELSLKSIDVTAKWLVDNRPLNSDCALVSDSATGFLLGTHLNLPIRFFNRPLVYNPSTTLASITSSDALKNYVEANQVCRLLIAIPEKMNLPPVSVVGQGSGHWEANLVQKELTLNKQVEKIADTVLTTGWTKTFVPPFYWLYENSK